MPQKKLRPEFTFDQDRVNQLKAIAPEAFADGKINWEVLQQALGEYIETETPETEHFGLSWPGKKESRRLASIPSTGTLVPYDGEGIDEGKTNNLFIEGDNLEVLKLLQKSYAGRVKMIYIDPPYNTGNDLIYSDNFRDPLDAYLLITGQKDSEGTVLATNPETSGRFHSNWLNMMYPRLRLARQLLLDDGVIFVSIDDGEVHHLKLMMSEIFGEENFVADVVAVNNLKGRNDKKYIATAHERLLIYANYTFTERGLPLPQERLEEYDDEDEGGSFRLLGLRKRGGADTRELRPNLFYPIYADPKSGKVSLEPTKNSVKVIPAKSDGTEGAWRWGSRTVNENLDILVGKPVGSSGRYDVFEKDYLKTEGVIRRMKPKSVLFGSDFSTDAATKSFRQLMGNTTFTNPKPVPFVRMLIDYSTEEDDLILDFFAGSCTTAQAVFEQNLDDHGNRRFIMIQLPEPTGDLKAKTIAEIGKERIRRVIKNLKKEKPKSDLGFKVFKLARSNFKAWQDYHGEDVKQLEMLFDGAETPLVEGWTPESLLTEAMLIQGFPLDSTITAQSQFKKNKVQLVESSTSAHRLFVCLDKTIHAETVSGFKPNSDDVFICLDSALTDQAKMRLANICTLATI